MRAASRKLRREPPPIQPPPRFVRNPNADYVGASEVPGAPELLAVAVRCPSSGAAGDFGRGAQLPRAVCEFEGCGTGLSWPALVAIHAQINPEHVDALRFEVVR